MKGLLRSLLFVLSLTATLGLTHTPSFGAEEEAKGGPKEFRFLKYRSIGPSAGGRVSRAAGVPGNPLIYYAGTAAGGVWKSTDGGLSWKPTFDEQPTSSIGSLAIAPSDANVVYVGSGEANIRGNVEPGNGIYKTSDGGKTWQHVWKQEGQIGTVVVHPQNADIAYAAVLGHAFGPNPERGVYRTTDGGKTWQQVLKKDADTGASDVCLDPSTPRVLFAGLWQARRRPWDMTSGGPGSGLYVSRDGGDTWTQLVPPPESDSPEADKPTPEGQKRCPGLPAGIWGKIGVAVAPSDSRRVYALIEAEKGGLFRSDDGGDTWKLMSDLRSLRQRAWYYSTLTVHPTNPDIVWCPQVPMLRSIDGGKTFEKVKGIHHGDNHDVWFDPKNPLRMIGSNDGGVDISNDGGQNWFAPPLPICQFYHVNADTRTPYHVSGTMQDLGTASGPTNSLTLDGIPLSEWRTVGGGETGFTAADPSDPNIIFAGEYGGYISRYDDRTRQVESVGAYPFNPSGHGASELKYRFQWTAPILISPSDSHVVYHAANVLFRSSDGGRHWSVISPDLTRNDRSKQQWSGGPITGDNTGAEYYCTIFAIAESPKKPGLLWAGSDDGLVHVSSDGGKNWSDVTKNIPGLPEWGTVCCIEASPFDADTAYVVVDAHRLDDMHPYLWKTSDRGKTWTSLTKDLPQDIHLHAVREDPKRQGLLYLGSERGVSFSTDEGRHWKELRLNLPTVAVSDLIVKENDLVLATNGRSLWILDDLTPVRQWSADVAEEEVHLFPVPPTVRYRYSERLDWSEKRTVGTNPPPGALVHYSLKRRPKGDITLEILNADGATVQTLSSKEEPAVEEQVHKEPQEPGEDDDEEGDDDSDNLQPGAKYKPSQLAKGPGLHRVVWDLRYAGANVIKGAKVDSGYPQVGPLVNPGTYTLVLTVEGKTYKTTLQVLLDPRQYAPAVLASVRGPGSTVPPEVLREKYIQTLEGELKEQLDLALKIREDVGRVADMVNRVRTIKEQLVERNKLLQSHPEAGDLVRQSEELVKRLDTLEEKLHNPKARIAYDILAQRGGARLYSQLTWLFEMIKSSDGAPTQGLLEVYDDQHHQMEEDAHEFKEMVSSDLVRLNETARKIDIPGIYVPRKEAPVKMR